ncbi:MAG: thioredoxin family protein [Bacteroidales bacterium]|nr:thioredoxin family protein [Bacteroidales bacterium]
MRLILPILMLSIAATAQQLPQRSLIDLHGNKVEPQELSMGHVLLLVASTECGYCLRDVKFLNLLAERYSDRVRFVVLLDSSKKDIELSRKMFASRFEFYNEHWTVIPSAQKHVRRLWKERIWPQYFFFVDGQFKRHYIYSCEETYQQLKDYLSSVPCGH